MLKSITRLPIPAHSSSPHGCLSLNHLQSIVHTKTVLFLPVLSTAFTLPPQDKKLLIAGFIEKAEMLSLTFSLGSFHLTKPNPFFKSRSCFHARAWSSRDERCNCCPETETTCYCQSTHLRGRKLMCKPLG